MAGRPPSRTALAVAVHRAVHQMAEGGRIFSDPFAVAILGPDSEALIAQRSAPQHRHMRLFVAVRSRFAQDCLTAAAARGVRQAVVLGAGLDTTALRNPAFAVFEVDHPATQDWKRRQLAQLNIALPENLRFAAVDFEHQAISDGLAAAGFNAAAPAFFVWLGVVPYLTRDAIAATLDFVASLSGGEIVFDYSEPPENYPPRQRKLVTALIERVAALGEPFRSYFHPAEMAALLRSRGFDDIEDLGPREIGARYFGKLVRADRAGGHIVRARRTG
ncbi:MAG TPA: SAM-dependent methyltransferase [Rhizomicrobium sp.]|nr:SAM-dependent methyltransferase [Rhizomicrobium sp.]